MEVRFQEGGKLYSQLLQTLRHRFLTTDLTARARHVPGPVPKGLREEKTDPTKEASTEGFAAPSSADEDRWAAHSERVTQVEATPRLNLPDAIPEFKPFPTGLSEAAGSPPAPTVTALPSGSSLPPGAEPWQSSSDNSSPGTSDLAQTTTELNALDNDASIQRIDKADEERAPSASHLGFQVHNRYLVTQDESGMVIVDQHALHERILYEQLREKAENKSLESQRLLVPEPLDLTPSEASAAIEHKEVLAKIGIEIEPFGGDTILMTSYPAMLASMRPAEVLRQVIEPLMSGGKEPSTRDILDELLHMIACKAAIKAGDRLAADEITALLEQRFHYQDTHHCPHGRPTALFFSRDQLDKMFKRT